MGQAALAVARRAREVGVRKVHGASAGRILALFLQETALVIGAACLVAWPVGCWVMGRFLQGYAYRVAVGPADLLWAVAVPGVLAVGVTACQTVSAALANPVEALRCE
ncbi:MAG: FtsX-like permease family protein [Candidatus Latescibacterota bacterium]